MVSNFGISSKYKLLIPLVKEVSVEILKIYESEIKTSIKDDESFVTQADFLASDMIIEFISKNFPDYGIISEEEDDSLENYNCENIFVIDPIDGTNGFIDKTGEFSIMIGVLTNFEPSFGLVYIPLTGELFIAEKGCGAFKISDLGGDDESVCGLKVSEVCDFKNSKMFRSRNFFSVNEKFICSCLNIPKFNPMGSIGIKVSRIANSENDIYLNLSSCLGKWDTCAPQIILEESGGEVFDKFGGKLKYDVFNERMLNGFIGTNSCLDKKRIVGCVLELLMTKKK